MKHLNTFFAIVYLSIGFVKAEPIETEKYIMVDQFGYRPFDEKYAVIIDPQAGFNSDDEFIAGSTYEVRVWKTDKVVYAGIPVPYKNLSVIADYGDRGWWFDFSMVVDTGDYYVYDVQNDVGSYKFRIHNDVYKDVLREAVRMFYYQRINESKEEPFAHANWTDPASFVGDNQDGNCHYVKDKTNESLVKDLIGGWMDAGDVNKYVTFADVAVHQLLHAFDKNPNAFPDNYNIPESGNNIPDIIDEVMYELDWIKKMQDMTDGGVHIKMGEIDYNGKSPPSEDRRPRFYGPKCSSAAIASAGMFAHAYLTLKQFPDLTSYADELLMRADSAYKWFENNDKSDNCDDGEIKAGDADRSLSEQEQMKVVSAIYLFAATGNETFHQVVKDGYNTLQPFVEPFWTLKYATHGDALMYYIQLEDADVDIVNTIVTKRINEGNSSEFYFNNNDLYRGYMPTWAYWWGSNSGKANVGIMNYDYINYALDSDNHKRYRDHALGILHFFHGINTFSNVFLSNMYHVGAEKSCDEIYHTWFSDGSKWDNAKDGIGPAPGYMPGGFNIYDNPNLRIKVGNEVYPDMLPDQPSLKKYSETNEFNSWSITEPAIYYQASYVYLLSNFIEMDCDTSIKVESLNLSADSLTLKQNFSTTIFSVVAPIDVCNNFVRYGSADTAIADISMSGIISGKAEGNTYIIAKSLSDSTVTDTCFIEVIPCERQSFPNSPISLPGKVEVEDFDLGCNDAYYDYDETNNGRFYRLTEGVDIEECEEGGYNIGWIEPEEWIEFTVDVQSPGTYNIFARVASANNTGKFQVSFDNGKVLSDTLDVSQSGSNGWQDWKTIYAADIAIEEKEQIMRISMHNSGFNLNWISITEEGIPDGFWGTHRSIGNILFYPNPSSGEFTIESTDLFSSKLGISIFDLTGKLVFTRTIKSSGSEKQIRLDLSLDRGMYIVKLTNGNEQIAKRLVIN